MASSNLPYFLLGLGVGAAAGLLYAPKTGTETRDELRRRAFEGRDFVKRKSGEFREQAQDAVGKGRSAVHTQRDQLAAALDAGRRAYQEATSADAGAPPPPPPNAEPAAE